jgi:hypothetical protein
MLNECIFDFRWHCSIRPKSRSGVVTDCVLPIELSQGTDESEREMVDDQHPEHESSSITLT